MKTITYWILIGAMFLAGMATHELVGRQTKPQDSQVANLASGDLAQSRQAFVDQFGDDLRKQYGSAQAEYSLLTRYVALLELGVLRCTFVPRERDECSIEGLISLEAAILVAETCLNQKCERELQKCFMHPDPDIRCADMYKQCQGSS